MSTVWRYVKIQSFVLLCGIVGPIFLAIYFASGAQPIMKWMFWAGLAITALDVLIALGITSMGTRSAAKTQALEQSGVLALAQVTGIHETGTRINEQPLVKIDLQISGPGIAPFASQDRVIASLTRLPMITSRKLVALVDPVTSQYQIDWERSGFVSGMMPATFTIAEDNKTYDLTGQVVPLMEILQILKANNVGLNNMIDLRSNPAARQQVQAVVRRAAAAQAPAQAAPAAAPSGRVLPRRPRGTVYGATLTGVGDPARDRCDLRRRIRGQATTDTGGSVVGTRRHDEHRDVLGEDRPEGQSPDADRDGRRVDDRLRRLPAAAAVRNRDGGPGAIIAWTIAGCGNADAGVRLSAPGHPQARSRRRDLRLRQGRVRRLRRLQLGHRVLGQSACAGNTSTGSSSSRRRARCSPHFGDGRHPGRGRSSPRSASGCSST